MQAATLPISTTKDVAKKRTPKKVLTMSKAQIGTLERVVTIALGCSIPVFSLVLSCLGGHMMTIEGVAAKAMGLFALGLCISILGVSLHHLADAIGFITKSPAWANWSMAITIDLTLVMCELASVYGLTGNDSLVENLRIGLMAAVCIWSMVLNCHAFLTTKSRHK